MSHTKANADLTTETVSSSLLDSGDTSHTVPSAAGNATFPFSLNQNENIKNFIGIDLHSDNIVVCVKQTVLAPSGRLQPKVISRMKIKTLGTEGLAEVEASLSPYCNNVSHVACVEATYNWYWLSNLFERNHWNLVLADPSTVSQSRTKAADDQTDAAYLAERMRTNSLHTAPIMGQHARAIRDLARYRGTLVEDCARKKITIINQIVNHSSIRIRIQDLTRRARETLDGHEGESLSSAQVRELIMPVFNDLVEDEEIRWILADELKTVLSLEDDIDCISKKIEAAVKPNPLTERLKSIKGCGPVLSAVIGTEIGDIHRFRSGKHFQSYCRLAKTSKLSNGKSKGEGNAKNGNAYLSWALTELANLVVRFNPLAAKEYQRLLSRSGGLRVKAIRSLAAKLARAIYHMLRGEQDFDVTRCFAR